MAGRTARGGPAVAIGALLVLASQWAACSAADGPATSGDTGPERGDEPIAEAAASLPASEELLLTFDHVAIPDDAVPAVENDGSGDVRLRVVTSGAGRLLWANGRTRGFAVRTPSATTGGRDPAAAIVGWPAQTDGPDDLEPGGADFAFGIDFRSDRVGDAGEADDGDNLIQRGRFGSAQYKLQVDHGVPSCRLAGTAGEVLVKADAAVPPDRWFRVTCAREDGAVTLTLTDLDAVGDEREEWPHTWHENEDPGVIAFEDVPISVGAKLDDLGRLDPTSHDQFRGWIDEAHVDIQH